MMEKHTCRWRSLAIILLAFLSLAEVTALKGTRSFRDERRLQKKSKSNDSEPVKTYCDSAQEGKAFVTNNRVDVYYKFEMVITTAGFPDVNQIITAYDLQIQQFLIKWLLMDECGDRRHLQSSHVMPIRGIGTGDVDYPLVDKKCEAFLSDATQSCYQVVGSQSIYLAEDRPDVDENELKFLIWETLMVGLNFDAIGYTKELAGVILGVQFIKGYERNPLLLTEGNTENSQLESSESPQGRSGVAKFGIVLFSFALIAAGVLACLWVYENRDELGLYWEAVGCTFDEFDDEESQGKKIKIKTKSTDEEGEEVEVEAPFYLSSPTATAPSVDSPTSSSMGSFRITPILSSPSMDSRNITVIEDNIIETPAETPSNEHRDREYEPYNPETPSNEHGDKENVPYNPETLSNDHGNKEYEPYNPETLSNDHGNKEYEPFNPETPSNDYGNKGLEPFNPETPSNEHGNKGYEPYNPDFPFLPSNSNFETPRLEEKQDRTRVGLRGKRTPDTVDL